MYTNQGRKRRKKTSLTLYKRKRVRQFDQNRETMLHHDIDDLECHTGEGISKAELPATPIAHGTKMTCPATPRKAHRKKQHLCKALFPDNNLLGDSVKRAEELLPSVLAKLEKKGLLPDFMTLLELISMDSFPLDNISFLLLLEVARWFGSKSTSHMFYSPATQLFWKVGYKLFHGKFLRFMGGEKSQGMHLSQQEELGNHNPQASSINFAVPTLNHIRSFQLGVTLPGEVPPGIIEQALETISGEATSFILSVDGKKVAPGFANNKGDEDLFGHETGLTLAERTQRLEQEKEQIQTMMSRVGELAKPIGDVVCLEKADWLSSTISNTVQTLSRRVMDLRHLNLKQELALEKFRKLAGEDWRNSKYVYAISSIQATIYQLKATIKKTLNTNQHLLEVGSQMRGSHDFTASSEVDPSYQKNWLRLSDLPNNLEDPRFIKQRSEKWFSLRNSVPLTGSTLYVALGLETLKKQQQHFDKVMKGVAVSSNIPDEVQVRMEYGTRNEPNAIATVVGQVLPFYQPELAYVEEGCHRIEQNGEAFVLVSPDGSAGMAHQDVPTPLIGMEIKCPTPAPYKTPVHYTIPDRYIIQVLAEMVALDVDSLLYITWSPESTTIQEIHMDNELWEIVLEEAVNVYGGVGKRPSCRSPFTREVRKKFDTFRRDCTTFLCEVPSQTMLDSGNSKSKLNSPYLMTLDRQPTAVKSCESLLMSLSDGIRCLDEAHQLCHRKASEVLVWMLADVNRLWKPEVPHAVPVAYAMKGYSLDTHTMRSMCESVLQAAKDKNIHVACMTFDGQWINLAVRDSNNRPLTRLQLQRDVASEAKALSKADICKYLVEWRPADEDICTVVAANGAQILSFPLFSKILKCKRLAFRKIKFMQADEQSLPGGVDLAVLPQDVLEGDAVSDLMEGSERDTNMQFELPEDQLEPEEVQQEVPPGECNVATQVLHAFQHHENEKIRQRWAAKTKTELQLCMSDAERLNRLTVRELDLILKVNNLTKTVQKSANKTEKVNFLSAHIGDGSKIQRFTRGFQSLQQQASHVISRRSSYTKDVLNVVYSTLMYRRREIEWESQSPFSQGKVLEGREESIQWFSYPSYSVQRGQLEPKCLDGEHLLVNARVKICKDGMLGLKKEAWHSVAEKDSSIISKCLVMDLIDKQSAQNAIRTFSLPVERCMEELGFQREANFYRLMRQLYEAEDKPGIPAYQRLVYRCALRKYLLQDVDFAQFPPYGCYIKGMPRVMFEGLLQSIDTHIQLYATCHGGTYNQRAVSSLVNETFFGELGELEPIRLGCPKATSIPRLLSTVTELLHYRHNPAERVFQMRTAAKSVYPGEKCDGLVSIAQKQQKVPCHPQIFQSRL